MSWISVLFRCTCGMNEGSLSNGERCVCQCQCKHEIYWLASWCKKQLMLLLLSKTNALSMISGVWQRQSTKRISCKYFTELQHLNMLVVIIDSTFCCLILLQYLYSFLWSSLALLQDLKIPSPVLLVVSSLDSVLALFLSQTFQAYFRDYLDNLWARRERQHLLPWSAYWYVKGDALPW